MVLMRIRKTLQRRAMETKNIAERTDTTIKEIPHFLTDRTDIPVQQEDITVWTDHSALVLPEM